MGPILAAVVVSEIDGIERFQGFAQAVAQCGMQTQPLEERPNLPT
jgi:hypothetical protein